MISSENGRVVDRSVATGVDDDLFISIEDGDSWWVPNDGLTGDRTWTIESAGALNGDEIEISMKDASNTLALVRAAGEGGGTIVLVGSSSSRFTVRLRRIAGAWELVSVVQF